MAIPDWPEPERPREKLLQHGAGVLSDAELLAIILRSGTRELNAVALAREVLLEFGGLRQLIEAPPARFIDTPGLGPARYAQLSASVEIAARHIGSRLRRCDAFSSPADTRRYLVAQLREHPNEVFAVLFLDNRHRLISFDKMFHGSIDGASVYPREVVRKALQHNAAAVILAHNHPSGIAEPSRADEQITARLKEALALVDVRVLDHMIVGEDVVSFAERGLL